MKKIALLSIGALFITALAFGLSLTNGKKKKKNCSKQANTCTQMQTKTCCKKSNSVSL